MARKKQEHPSHCKLTGQTTGAPPPKRRKVLQEAEPVLESINLSEWKQEIESEILVLPLDIQIAQIPAVAEIVLDNYNNLHLIERETRNSTSFDEWDAALLEVFRALHQECLFRMHISDKSLQLELAVSKYNPGRNSQRRHIQTLMKWSLQNTTLSIEYPYPKEIVSWPDCKTKPQNPNFEYNATAFYTFTTAKPQSIQGDTYKPSNSLLPQLRPYQKAAIAWMLDRERQFCIMDEEKCTIHYVTLPHGIFYDPFSVEFMCEKPSNYNINNQIRGGLLADEMGLGKTVEVLGVILSNPRENIQECLEIALSATKWFQCFCCSQVQDPFNTVECTICHNHVHAECIPPAFVADPSTFICLACWRDSPPLACKTTLIISPERIHRQWLGEVTKHSKFGALSVFIYEGVQHTHRCQKSSNRVHLWPSELAKYDIVITTYGTLRQDIHYTEQSNRTLRRGQKYPPPPSPLTQLEWWRLCLDEAQMIESASAKASIMASRLYSVNRWCVTGTPFSRNLDDFWGLFSFWNIQPFCTAKHWKNLLREPFLASRPERLQDVLKILMWRNTKSDVINQIGIPVQSQVEYWLNFSPVEEQFYKSQERDCRRLMSSVSQYLGRDSSSISVRLLRLRQACAHPQVGQHGVGSIRKVAMSMNEILQKMIKNATLECEEEQRSLIALRNLTAGLMILDGRTKDAIQTYLESMSQTKANWKLFRTDKLQRFHILHNALKLLRTDLDITEHTTSQRVNPEWQPRIYYLNQKYCTKVENVDRNHLLEECEDLHHGMIMLQKQYLMDADHRHDSVHSRAIALKEKADQSMKDKDGSFGRQPWWDQVLRNIDLSSFLARLESQGVSLPVYDISGLRYILISRHDEIQSARHELLSELMRQSEPPKPNDVHESGNCRTCRAVLMRTGPECKHCRLEPSILAYQELIFQDGSLERDSDLFIIMNELRRYSSGHTSDQAISNLFSVYETLQNELTWMKKLWLAQHERLSSLDELDMAKTTMQLRETGQPDLPNTIDAHMIDVELEDTNAQQAIHVANLNKARHHLMYLKNLESSIEKPDEDDSTCAICQESMKEQHVILPCAHSYCYNCTMRLCNRAYGRRFHCPKCRATTSADECQLTQQAVPIISGHGTKIDHVVYQASRIMNQDPTAKILLFSLWADMLKLVKMALDANSIKCWVADGRASKFSETIDAFCKSRGSCVLGLLFHNGASGLNLTEANHVFLLDPTLDSGVEAQAINRVHRIGQDRETTVHRFLIKDSIDERIFNKQASIEKEVGELNIDQILVLLD